MKDTIKQRKYKHSYNSLLVTTIITLIIFFITRNELIHQQCWVKYNHSSIGLWMLLIYSISSIMFYFILKFDSDNYAIIELEGNVIEQNRFIHPKK